jgi:nitroreductase
MLAERPLSSLDVLFVRRSVRHYAPHVIPQSTIRSLLDAAVQAPTALHEEPWAFVVVQDAATLKRISDRAKTLWLHEGEVHRALHTGVLAREAAGFAQRLADPAFSIFYNAGTLIVICAKPMGPFAEADCWLAAENLMLAATAIGLGTCCIGSALPALRAPDIKADLRIPLGLTAVVPIIVGVPADEQPGPAKRRDPEILYWR